MRTADRPTGLRTLLARAEAAARELDSALRRAGSVLPSLGSDPLIANGTCAYPLLGLGRIDRDTARHLAEVIARGAR